MNLIESVCMAVMVIGFVGAAICVVALANLEDR